ncbi:thioredoxin-like domain-containing protein [Belliella kenyensis]|uniref:Thioredoxin-like domain-containing protein n=1 Tax=Belliella kenyensis TaxID=1472724 RepID=A0ABV8EFV0_9BACT|nr:redoxin domain-containing protein [Belliella kenyensis]MCH7401094.1 redoxin domain-containing protein [Belliella kenyensis]MDN3604091.1 redoxin domain-containing protein [Belliella kenyensis]
MKNIILSIILVLSLVHYSSFAQRVDNFQLEDIISGNSFELAQHQEAKAVVLIFTTVSCPFSKLYENRIFEFHEKFTKEGFVFALVNPHHGNDPEESKEAVSERFKNKANGLVVLNDGDQSLMTMVQASKLPEVVVITPGPTGFAIAYKGAIDNNPQVPESANMKYLQSALQSIQSKRSPSPSSSRAVGCNIRLK